MNWPLVTIGIPTFNRADQYLKEAIESAVNQTYPNLDIIVSDNCSSDDTGQIVKSFNNSRIRYHRHDKNIGGNANFNFCLKQARGAFFLLLHDDDLIDNDFIETCINAIGDRHEIGIVRTGTREIDQDGNVLIESPNTVEGLSNEEFYRHWFAWKTSLYLCSTLFNTSRLTEIGGFQSKHNLFQDVLAEFHLAAVYGRIDIFDVKASFRKHPGAETFASEVGAWCEDSAFLLDLICKLSTKDQVRIRKEGLYYFSKFNYILAKNIKSPLNRYIAYITLIRTFKSASLRELIYKPLRRSAPYSLLRSLKNKFLTSSKSINIL